MSHVIGHFLQHLPQHVAQSVISSLQPRLNPGHIAQSVLILASYIVGVALWARHVVLPARVGWQRFGRMLPLIPALFWVISKAIYGHGTAPEYRWACIQMVMYVITYLLEAINVTKVIALCFGRGPLAMLAAKGASTWQFYGACICSVAVCMDDSAGSKPHKDHYSVGEVQEKVADRRPRLAVYRSWVAPALSSATKICIAWVLSSLYRFISTDKGAKSNFTLPQVLLGLVDGSWVAHPLSYFRFFTDLHSKGLNWDTLVPESWRLLLLKAVTHIDAGSTGNAGTGHLIKVALRDAITTFVPVPLWLIEDVLMIGATCLVLGAAMDAACAWAALLFRIPSYASFNNPVKSASITELWHSHWNILVGQMYRWLVYDAILEGRLLADGPIPGDVSAAGSLVQGKQQQSGDKPDGQREDRSVSAAAEEPAMPAEAAVGGDPQALSGISKQQSGSDKAPISPRRRAKAVLTVFVLNGALHEFAYWLCNRRLTPGLRWLQFFTAQGLAVLVERAYLGPTSSAPQLASSQSTGTSPLAALVMRVARWIAMWLFMGVTVHYLWLPPCRLSPSTCFIP